LPSKRGKKGAGRMIKFFPLLRVQRGKKKGLISSTNALTKRKKKRRDRHMKGWGWIILISPTPAGKDVKLVHRDGKGGKKRRGFHKTGVPGRLARKKKYFHSPRRSMINAKKYT